jgi:glycosyltransferase involved in cell wall biosynthesis
MTVVVPVYNCEEFVAEALTAILSQTRPPEEVVVVDDGSTDGTRHELERFRGDIRVVRQANQGHPGAYNRGFAEARGDYIARCDADDVWEPAKLERQAAALRAHPEIDVATGAAWVFGRRERPFAPAPGEGILRGREFARTLYRDNIVCAPATMIRRRLFEQLGPFIDRLPCEDYEYWLRALKARAVFFYDPEVLVRYREHGGNVTNNRLRMCRATQRVHTWHADAVDDSRLVRTVLALDHFRIARLLLEQDRLPDARAEFVASLRQRPAARALVWALALSAPGQCRQALVGSLAR